MNISDRAKWFAIGQVLSEWPDGATADAVIDEAELMTDDVVVWQPFEDYDGEWIALHILDLALAAQLLIDEAVEEYAEAGDLE